MIPVIAVSLLVAGAARPATPTVQPAAIHWEKSFEEAQKKARKTGKPIFIDFWAEWCGWCDRLNRTTYVDPMVARKAQDFVAVKIDTEGSHKEREIAMRYEVSSLPTIVFVSPSGRQLSRVNSFEGAYQFLRTLQTAHAIAERVIASEDALDDDPNDAQALAALGAHLYDVGVRETQQQCLDEARVLLRHAVEHDAEQPLEERRRSRMLLAILYNFDREFVEAEKLVKDALSLAADPDDASKLLFVLGRTYMSAGRRTESVETFQIIIQQYPESPAAKKARETLINLQPR